MDIRRKIQLAAFTVIANGAVALALMSSSSALAATCSSPGPSLVCDNSGFCPVDAVSACAAQAPAGCTAVVAVCWGSAPCSPVSAARVYCDYQ